MIKIDNVQMPAPSVYRIPEHDLDSENTGRNERGYLQRDRLRQGVFKIEMEWWGVNNNTLATLMNAIKPSKVSVEFLTESGYKTKQMYVGDRSKELVRYMGDTNKMAWNVSFNLTEY